MKEKVEALFKNKNLTYIFCLLAYPRSLSVLDNISYLLRVSFLIELTLKEFVDVEISSEKVIVKGYSEDFFYRKFINKIEKRKISFKKLPNAMNGEFINPKYNSLNIKKLRKNILKFLAEENLIENVSIKFQKFKVTEKPNVQKYIKQNIINFLISGNLEDNLFYAALIFMLKLSGNLDFIQKYKFDERENVNTKISELNKKIMNGCGNKKPDCIVYAYLKNALK